MAEVTLRPIVDADLPTLFAQERDELARQMAAFVAENPDDWEGFQAHWARVRADQRALTLAIEADGALAGSIALHRWFGLPEVTYWVGREHWGQGVATRALALLLERVAERPLYARVAKENLASRRVLEKCGFALCGEGSGYAAARRAETPEWVLMLPDSSGYPELLGRWVARLRAEHPSAVAILTHGSYARGAAEAHSDLDLDVLTHSEPESAYRSAFEELPDGRLLHATIATMQMNDWLEQFDGEPESEEWAYYLPVRQAARLLWATPAAARLLEGRVTLELRASPQLQDMLEGAAKARNAHARGDTLGLRLAAQDMAQRVPALLALLGQGPPAASRREALHSALALPVTPPGYREDLLDCLGLSGRATSPDDILAAALHLAGGVVALLRANPAALPESIEPGLPEALADGRLERLLTQ